MNIDVLYELVKNYHPLNYDSLVGEIEALEDELNGGEDMVIDLPFSPSEVKVKISEYLEVLTRLKQEEEL